jgi:hypothetical protein
LAEIFVKPVAHRALDNIFIFSGFWGFDSAFSQCSQPFRDFRKIAIFPTLKKTIFVMAWTPGFTAWQIVVPCGCVPENAADCRWRICGDSAMVLAACIAYVDGVSKRGRIILAAVFLAVTGGLVWWLLTPLQPGPPDLVYDGHPLSYWVNPPGENGVFKYGQPSVIKIGIQTSSSTTSSTYIFLKSLDSNAVPFLVESLKRQRGGLRRVYNGFWRRAPSWLQNHLPAPKHAWIRDNTFFFLQTLGVSARPAIPELIRILREEDGDLYHDFAIVTLGVIATRDDKSAVEALVAATRDPDGGVRQTAVEEIERLDPDTAAKAGVTNSATDAADH